jgi:protein gp37
MNKSNIEWCTRTWNPVTGCKHGCSYCFAKDIAHRFVGCGYDKDGCILPGAFEMETEGLHVLDEPMYRKTKAGEIVQASFPFEFAPTFHRYRLGEPAKEKKPQNVFVVDMGDLFGELVPDEWIREVFAACEAAPWHNYMFLTKNSKRYFGLQTRDNYWYGTTVTNRSGEVFTRGQG